MNLELFSDNSSIDESPLTEDTTSSPSKAELWKAELINELKQLALAYSNFESAKIAFEIYNDKRTTLYHLDHYIEIYFSSWINMKCKEVTSESNIIGHLQIESNALPDNLSKINFPSNLLNSDDRDKVCSPLIKWVANNYQFDLLYYQLNKIAKDIDTVCFKKTANELARKFGLVDRSQRKSVLKIPKIKGRYVLEVSHYGNWIHDRITSLIEFKQFAKSFQNESDVLGLDYCIQLAVNEEKAIHHHSYDHYVDSRTKVAAGEPVEATFFKDKIKFAFEPDLFEALLCFIREYADPSDLVSIEV